MVSENLYKRVLRLRYKVIEDGKEKNFNQSYSNIKLTSTSSELYASGNSIKTLINSPSVDIEKDDSYTLENE